MLKHIQKIFILFATVLLLVCTSQQGYSQESPSSGTLTGGTSVVLDQSLFNIRARIGPFSVEEGAKAISERLLKIAQYQPFEAIK